MGGWLRTKYDKNSGSVLETGPRVIKNDNQALELYKVCEEIGLLESCKCLIFDYKDAKFIQFFVGKPIYISFLHNSDIL